MADYIYMMEARLSPEQLRGVSLVQDAARAHNMNVYLVGGALRDMMSGAMIRDLDIVVQGNALKLQKDLERAGIQIEGINEELRILYLLLPGGSRAEISTAREERYDKPGKPPQVTFGTINEDMRRRDFTVNAMGLSLNPGSRGLLLDPYNGVADVEAKHLRILHNYAFLEEPSRLVRATRFLARFHWTLEERTQARYNSAKENDYIENVTDLALGREIEGLSTEDDPLPIVRALEKEGWLKVLHPGWSLAKMDTDAINSAVKLRHQLQELGYSVDTAATFLHFMTRRLPERDVRAIQKKIPRKGLVDRWNHLETEAKELTKRLTGKETAQPSQAWQLLSATRPENIIFTEVTTRNQAVSQKIRNFLTKWRQVKQRLPLPEMAEMRITPEIPEFQRVMDEAFLLLLDGKLRNHAEIVKFLEPYSPPEPPPPPPPSRRGRAPKARAAEAAASGKRGTPDVEKVSAELQQALAEPAKKGKSGKDREQTDAKAAKAGKGKDQAPPKAAASTKKSSPNSKKPSATTGASNKVNTKANGKANNKAKPASKPSNTKTKPAAKKRR